VQILAHEVGHHLAGKHQHKFPDYKYTTNGLSSNDPNPKKFKLTIQNVLTIVNDENNQNE